MKSHICPELCLPVETGHLWSSEQLSVSSQAPSLPAQEHVFTLNTTLCHQDTKPDPQHIFNTKYPNRTFTKSLWWKCKKKRNKNHVFLLHCVHLEGEMHSDGDRCQLPLSCQTSSTAQYFFWEWRERLKINEVTSSDLSATSNKDKSY